MNRDDFEPSLARHANEVVLDIETRRFLTIALLINSALFLAATSIAGLILGNRIAWGAALLSCGLSYLAPMWQLIMPGERWAAMGLVMLSIMFGAIAGAALLFF